MPSEVESSLICLSPEIPRLRCDPLEMTKASLEKTLSCPCKIRARGLMTIPAMKKECSCDLRARGSRLLGFGNGFGQVLRVHLEDGELGIFKHL